MDEQLWKTATLFLTDKTSDSERCSRKKLITLLHKGGIKDVDRLARTIIFNFEKKYTAAWYLPTRGYSMGDLTFKAPSKVWHRAFKLLVAKGLLDRYKTSSDLACDRYRFTQKFTSWFSLPLLKVSFFPYRFTHEGKERGTAFKRTHFFEPLKEVLEGYSIITDRTIFRTIDFRMNLSEVGENGRLTAGYQQISKTERSTLRFIKDDISEGASEIDIVGAHLQILYAKAGIKLDGDPYDIGFRSPFIDPEKLRYLVKRALFLLVNTGSRSQALSSLLGYTDCSEGKGLARSLHNYLVLVLNDGEGESECIRGQAHYWLRLELDKLIDLLLERHSPIVHLMEKYDSSCLMWIESELLLNWLLKLSELGVPALPLHDAVIVPRSKAELCLSILTQVWDTFFDLSSEKQLEGLSGLPINTLAVIKTSKNG